MNQALCEALQNALDKAEAANNANAANIIRDLMNEVGCGVSPTSVGGGGDPPPEGP